VVAIFSKGILEGRELTINGDGAQTRDYVYVADVVRANLVAAEVPLGPDVPVLNIGTGKEISVNDLVRLFRDIAGRNVTWRHGPPRPGEQRRSVLDSALAKRVLGWEARTDLGAGLSQTFQWFQARYREA
jgi:UDP-glucose 4-epimerase